MYYEVIYYIREARLGTGFYSKLTLKLTCADLLLAADRRRVYIVMNAKTTATKL